MRRIVVVALLAGLLKGITAQTLGTITVNADSVQHNKTVIRVPMPQSWHQSGPLRLVELSGTSSLAIPAQLDSEATPGLWFILPGSTTVGQSRSFRLEIGEGETITELTYHDTYPYRELRWGTQPILRYNYGRTNPPAGMNPSIAKDGGYIHPLFSPVGDTLTGDFPLDHPHHHGLFMPWRQGIFEGHRVDFWVQDTPDSSGVIHFKKFLTQTSGPIFTGFTASHEHLDMTPANIPNGKPVLNETWDVKAFALGGTGASGAWVFDITSTQRCAGTSPLKLLEWEYQGMTFRGNSAWDGKETFLTPSGKIERPTRERWQVMSGLHGQRRSSVVLMTHPKNFHFPEATSIWPGISFFAYTPVDHTVKEWTLEPGQDYIFRYRFVANMGQVDAAQASQYWNDFASAPTATFQADPAYVSKRSILSKADPDFSIRPTVLGLEVLWPNGHKPGQLRLYDSRGLLLGATFGQGGQQTIIRYGVKTGVAILRMESHDQVWERKVFLTGNL